MCLLARGAHAAVTLTTLYSFHGPDGANPAGGLVQGADGNLYGTTTDNGYTSQYGTIFRISPEGVFTNLYSFNGSDEGAWPQLGLVLGSDGNFYGTTPYRGVNFKGTIFRLTLSGDFGVVAPLDTTSGSPGSVLVAATDGNFYCVGNLGAGAGMGSVFSMTPGGTLTNLALFCGSNGFSGWSFSRDKLLQGADGSFYGMTEYGGPEFNGEYQNPAYGTIFSMAADGTLTTLVSFNGTNGAYLTALIQGRDGNLYGTTSAGGPAFVDNPTWGGQGGYGTIFKLTTNGALTTLGAFNGANGNAPNSLVLASDGNFYGTASAGGTNGGRGTIFKLTPAGALTSLSSFAGTNGTSPAFATLLETSTGVFYGTTYSGGVSNYGTIFRLTIPPPPPQVSIAPDGNGGYFIYVHGTSNLIYRLQRSYDLSGPWTTSAPQTASASGLVEFHDLFPPPDHAFYRTVQQ